MQGIITALIIPTIVFWCSHHCNCCHCMLISSLIIIWAFGISIVWYFLYYLLCTVSNHYRCFLNPWTGRDTLLAGNRHLSLTTSLQISSIKWKKLSAPELNWDRGYDLPEVINHLLWRDSKGTPWLKKDGMKSRVFTLHTADVASVIEAKALNLKPLSLWRKEFENVNSHIVF